MRRRGARKFVMFAAIAVLSVGSVPAFAGDETGAQTGEKDTEQQAASADTKKPERNWRMRFLFAAVGDGGFSVSSGGDHGSYVGTRGGGGVGINFEYRYSPRMGIEVGAMALASDIGIQTKDGTWHDHWGSVGLESFVPISFGLNYHPLRNTEVFDLFVGPLLTSTFYSGIGAGAGWAGVESGVSIGAGLNLGADLNLGKSRWSLNGGLKYIAYADGGRDGITLDPLMVTFGVGFKF